MQREVQSERFFTSLISGDRVGARQLLEEAAETEGRVDQILTGICWPTLHHIQSLYRADQISQLAHHYATRLMRNLIARMQPKLEQRPSRNKRVLVVSGNEQSEELAAQIVSDLLEADGYAVHYVGGGIANDELVAEIGNIQVDVLVVFGAMPATVPQTRLLIDRLHEIAVCPSLQIVVGGGVFGRADGLAEEIGADLWANDPEEIVKVMHEQVDRRMETSQRTVGRRRRGGNKKDAA